MAGATRRRRRLCAGAEHLVGVELVDLHRAVRRGVDAQRAEDALVDVAVDDLHAAVGRGEDVDRAGLLELARELGIARHRVVDLDADERRVVAHQALTPCPIRSLTRSGIWLISSATTMPASARRAIFSVAVSSLPSTIVPAWPKLMPGISSMNRPAMNATIGRRESFSVTHLASSASMRPPGSV